MPKPSLLAALKPAQSTLTQDLLAERTRDAHSELTEAEAAYGRAALAFAEGQSGSSEPLHAAQQAVQRAREAVQALVAAQGALDAQEAQRASAESRAAQEAMNKRSRAVFDRQAKLAAKGEAIITDYADWYDEFREVEALAQAEFGENHQLRDIALPITDAVRDEIARVSHSDLFMPPGANVVGASLEDRHASAPLGKRYADRAKAIFQP